MTNGELIKQFNNLVRDWKDAEYFSCDKEMNARVAGARDILCAQINKLPLDMEASSELSECFKAFEYMVRRLMDERDFANLIERIFYYHKLEGTPLTHEELALISDANFYTMISRQGRHMGLYEYVLGLNVPGHFIVR